MATKKTTRKKSSQKTSSKKRIHNAKSTHTRKTIAKNITKKTEPHHAFFGLIMVVTGFAIFLALIVSFAYFLAKMHTISDAEKFAAEYSQVENDNLFVYATGDEVIEILENGTGVVFLGFPSCPWCQAYVPMLNALAKEAGISKIYYHNTYEDWQKDTDDYKKITEILSSNLQFDEKGNRHLYVPDVVFVKNGVVIGNDFETSKDTADATSPEEYWTNERIENFKARIMSFLTLLK